MLLQKVFYSQFHKEDMKVFHLLTHEVHFCTHTKDHRGKYPLVTISCSMFIQDGF